MNISLTPQLLKYVTRKVASGKYQTASEVVREGLRALEERDAERVRALRDVRSKVQHGLDQARQGKLVEGERFFDEMFKTIRAKRRKAG